MHGGGIGTVVFVELVGARKALFGDEDALAERKRFAHARQVADLEQLDAEHRPRESATRPGGTCCGQVRGTSCGPARRLLAGVKRAGCRPQSPHLACARTNGCLMARREEGPTAARSPLSMTTLVRLGATLVTAVVLAGTPASARQPVGFRHVQLGSARPVLQVQVGSHPVSQGFRPLTLPRKPEASPPTAQPEFFNPLKRRRMALPATNAPDSF